MKKIIFILPAFISLYMFTQSNKVSAQSKTVPPKGVSIIYVKNVSFDSVVAKLKEKGFSFEQLIKNSFIKAKRGITTISFVCYNIRYNDSTAEIIGSKYVSQTDQKAFRNTFPDKKDFKEMNEFALSLNGNVSYEK